MGLFNAATIATRNAAPMGIFSAGQHTDWSDRVSRWPALSVLVVTLLDTPGHGLVSMR